MKPLLTNQKVLMWLCIYPVNENASKFVKLARVAFTFLVIITELFGLIASVVFFMKFFSVDLEKSLYTIFQIVALISNLYMFVVLCGYRYKIIDVFKHLTEIYNASKILLQYKNKNNENYQKIN